METKDTQQMSPYIEMSVSPTNNIYILPLTQENAETSDFQWDFFPSKCLEQDSELEVLCTNCHDYINPQQVDLHSQVCTQPLLQTEDSSLVDFRIRKLAQAVKARKLRSFGDKVLLLLQIEDLAKASIDKSLGHAEIMSSLKSIISTSYQVTDGISCYIYARRLQFLVEAKGSYDIEDWKVKELDKWKNRVGFLLQLAGNSMALSDINSEVSSDKGSVLSFSTGLSEGHLNLKHTLSDIGNEELERHFFSLCIQRKTELDHTHPLQNLPISEVYQRVKLEGIEISAWKDYINEVYS